MYVKSIDLKQIFKSKKTKVFVAIITVILISLIAVYTLYKVSRLLNGDSIKNITEYIGGKESSIFNMTSYEAEYDVIIISNKNTNSYAIKELYSSGKTKYEYVDSIGSKVSMIINQNKIKIQNDSQKNVMVQDFENIGMENTISISTFLEIYNIKGSIPIIETKEYLKDGYLKILMKVRQNEDVNNLDDKYTNILKNISNIELEINEKTKLPSTYIVYNKNKKEVVSIIYNKFNINPKIDSKIFDIY